MRAADVYVDPSALARLYIHQAGFRPSMPGRSNWQARLDWSAYNLPGRGIFPRALWRGFPCRTNCQRRRGYV